MDFELSDDQVALRDAAAEMLDDLASPARVRAHLGSGSHYDATLWDALVAQGWLAVEQDESSGGLGLGFVEAMVLSEQVGRHVAPVPFHQVLLALAATRGTPWASRLLSGEVACVAWRPDADRPVLAPYAPAASFAVVASPSGVVVHELSGGVAAEPAMDLTRCVGWLAPSLPVAPGGEVGGPAEAVALLDRGGGGQYHHPAAAG